MRYSPTIQQPSALLSTFPKVVTFTGAGGKTSLMYWLATVFANAGRRVVTTTTTKIFPPKNSSVVLQEASSSFHEDVARTLATTSPTTVAKRFDEASGKLIGLDTESLSNLYDASLADTIFAEGDGAARKPLKAPAQHEPVIPAETDICIGVMGLDSLFKPLNENLVHRPDAFSRITGVATEEAIHPQHLIALAEAEDGLFQHCPETSRKHVFLNKMDIPEGRQLVAEFADALSRHTQNPAIDWFATSTTDRKIFSYLRVPTCPSSTLLNTVSTDHSSLLCRK